MQNLIQPQRAANIVAPRGINIIIAPILAWANLNVKLWGQAQSTQSLIEIVQ